MAPLALAARSCCSVVAIAGARGQRARGSGGARPCVTSQAGARVAPARGAEQQQQRHRAALARLVARAAAEDDGGLGLEEPETAREAIDLGLVLCKQQKWDKALAVFEKGLGLPGTGVKRFRDKPRLISDGEKMAALYNIACCHSQLQDARSGLVALSGALELGYSDYAQIRGDPDLAFLRADERFEGLLARFAKANAGFLGLDLAGLFGGGKNRARARRRRTRRADRSPAPRPPAALRQTRQPGMEIDMEAKPIYIRDTYKGAGKLEGKVAIITGGDSGIGRAVAVHFAREGADVAILYLDEHKARRARGRTLAAARRRQPWVARPPRARGALHIESRPTAGDVVGKVVQELGRLDVLVNNASVQHYTADLADITVDQARARRRQPAGGARRLKETFEVNVFGYFYMAQAALKHLKEGASIINTSSITAYKGSPSLIAFTRALSNQLVPKGIRVNAVAPGPIWTPLISATFPKARLQARARTGAARGPRARRPPPPHSPPRRCSQDMIEHWKSEAQMKRPGQPAEVGPSYVFLACEDASYISGQARRGAATGAARAAAGSARAHAPAAGR
ncbi:yhxC [Scenedesmus sp. PABB004]|nr:yhxC [Scenedesmus sp. PABB004]